MYEKTQQIVQANHKAIEAIRTYNLQKLETPLHEQMEEFDSNKLQQKRYQDQIVETTKEIQNQHDKIERLQDTIEHLNLIQVELLKKQEIISSSKVQLLEINIGIRKEIEQLMVEGENNSLNKLKEDILTESLICESKKRELAQYETLPPDQEPAWDYWADEPEFELPKDNELEEETGFLSSLPSLPSFNFISSDTPEQAPLPPK